MQVLGPFFAKFPKLVTQSLKVVVNHDEESNKLENKKGTIMSHDKVIDLEEERTKKDASAAQPVVIIDSDEEDDRDKNSSLPFNEVMFPNSLQSPALRMMVSSPGFVILEICELCELLFGLVACFLLG